MVFNCNPNGLQKIELQLFHFILSILVCSIFKCVPTSNMDVLFSKCIPFDPSILKMERFLGNEYRSIFMKWNVSFCETFSKGHSILLSIFKMELLFWLWGHTNKMLIGVYYVLYKNIVCHCPTIFLSLNPNKHTVERK